MPDYHFPRVAIKSQSDSPDGWQCLVTLDGKMMPCREIYVACVAGGLNTVTMVFDAVVDVDLPAEVTVMKSALGAP